MNSGAGFRRKVFEAEQVTSTDTVYSKVWQMEAGSQQAIQYAVGGTTPTGTWSLWKSVKEDPDEADDTDWVQQTATFNDPAGAGAKGMIDGDSDPEMRYCAAPKWRLKYVNASGTSVLDAEVFAGKRS